MARFYVERSKSLLTMISALSVMTFSLVVVNATRLRPSHRQIAKCLIKIARIVKRI